MVRYHKIGEKLVESPGAFHGQLARRGGMVAFCFLLGFVLRVFVGQSTPLARRDREQRQRAADPSPAPGFPIPALQMSARSPAISVPASGPDPAIRARFVGSYLSLPLTFEP